MQKCKTKTTEFSFILKPAKHGIGVFATHNIKIKTFLRLFGDKNNYNYYALRNIKIGEEIVINYNTLEEIEIVKDNYYKK